MKKNSKSNKLKENEHMVFVKECLQRQEGRYCPTEDQKEENRSLSDYGLKTIPPK